MRRSPGPKFTPEEDELIRRYYNLGRTVIEPMMPTREWRQIINRACRIGATIDPGNRTTRRRYPNPFTFEEDVVLRRMWEKGGAPACAKAMPGRTLRAIRRRAGQLKLDMTLDPNYKRTQAAPEGGPQACKLNRAATSVFDFANAI